MEDKCNRCGKCCYLRAGVLGVIIETKEKCQYLSDNNLCTVYNARPSWCLTAERMIEMDILPEGCGYEGGV